MAISEREVDRIARRALARYGPRAAIAAAERLNASIDRGNWSGRDAWARIVQRIHEYQRRESDAAGLGLAAPARPVAAVPGERRSGAAGERV